MENEMIHTEKRELTVKDWLITHLIVSIPMVGFIMMLVWAFDDATISVKKTWARAMLIWMAINPKP